jgi:hypothetical protein
MALADALDIQLDLQVDAISEENAIREGGVIRPALYTINKFMENRVNLCRFYFLNMR